MRLFYLLHLFINPLLVLEIFTLYGGGKGSSPPPPDYTPMATASKEVAEIGAALGREQLDESKRQYDQNMEVSKPIVDAQLRIMEQNEKQGDDYYNYMVKNQRPVEEALNAQSMIDGSEKQQEQYADRAQADSLAGYTKAMNIAARQGMRYGFSTDKIAAQAGAQAGTMASALANSANAGRQQSQDKGWARKMDVAGLYRGLPGASTGAYGMAVNSGNAAMGNQMQPGQALLGGMAQGAGMVQQGKGQQIQGLGQVLNSQTSIYNSGQNAAAQNNMGYGQILGAGVGVLGSLWK